MQKIYRDSKGKFVSRENLVEDFKFYLNDFRENSVYYNDKQFMAQTFRQFRIRHGIYECF